MTQRSYRVRFYGVRCGADGAAGKLSEILREVAARPGLPPARLMYQVRGLDVDDKRKELRGYFVKFRDEPMMVSSAHSPAEEIIELEEGKQYIEKNAFIIFYGDPKREIIEYQMRLEGGHITAFAKYLTELNGNKFAITFDDILTPDALELLADGVVKSVEFRIAKPTAKKFAPDPDDAWTKDAMQFMNSAGATVFTGKIATRKPGKGLAVKHRIAMLLGSPQTRALRVKLSEHDDPIDLFAERVSGKIEVTEGKDGVQPLAVYSSMRKEKVRVQPQLDAYFGIGNEALE